MVILFVVLGVLAGGMSGSFWGALVGGVAGYFFAEYRKASKETKDKKTGQDKADRPLPPPTPASDAATQLVRKLEHRIQALEKKVEHLQATVDGLAPVPDPQAIAEAEPIPAITEAELEAQALAAPPVEYPPFPSTEPSALDEPVGAKTQAAEAIVQPVIQPDEQAEPAVLASSTAAAPAHETPATVQGDWPDDDIKQVFKPAPPGRRPPVQAPPRTFKDRIPARLQPLIFGGNTIVKMGVLILFLGLSFLLRYVAEQVTVPVEMRYAGVALLGVGLLGMGWRLRDRRDASGSGGYGLILQGAGVGVFYLTTLAAMKLHPLLSTSMGFAIMVLVSAFTAVLAVAQNAPWLAYVASSAGFLTPILVSTGHANHIALFSYLAILDMGIVAMAWFRAWRPLNLIGFVGTFTLAGGWATSHYTPEVYASTQGFLLLFFLMFTAIGVLFARRALALGEDVDPQDALATRAAQALRQVGRVDSTLVFGVPLAAYGLQYQMVRDDPWLPALSALMMGLFYMLLGSALWRGKQARYALLAEAYVVVGVLFGTLSIPLALEGVWTGATWAIEAAGMYWLGTRQHRTYTRAFAMALLAGAAVRTLSSLGWNDAPQAPLLTGSLLGMLMLAASALFVGQIKRRAAQTDSGLTHAPWENNCATGSWWLAVLALACLPWMLLMPLWASVSMAALALACLWLGERLAIPDLKPCAPVAHLVAVSGFASTLHQHEGQAMLANGVQGLSAAVLIGLSMLASAWLGLRETWQRATSPQAANEPAPQWPLASSLGIVAGLALICGALLFMMPLAHAALVWPVLGLAMLGLALKLAHPALALMWAALTGASALAFMAVGPAVWPQAALPATHPAWHGPLGGLAWWTPLMLMTCTVTAGAWLHRAAQRQQGWRMPWVSAAGVHLFMVGASLWWWAQTLPPEILRHLTAHDLGIWVPAAMSLWVTFSSAMMLMLARRLDWPLMGQAAGLTIPMWMTMLFFDGVTGTHPPLSHLGWLAWPVALLWHPVALRHATRWWSRAPQTWMHVGGFWLFGFIAWRQIQWVTEQWAPPGSAWQALGWLLVPLLLVGGVSSQALGRRWPVRDFIVPYRFVAALPLLMALIGWLAWSLFNAGHAAPLPYVPLLNPLELGQGLTLLTMAMWVRAQPEDTSRDLPAGRARLGLLGGIGFAMLTAMVLRTCHHWAGIPWDEHALFASRLAQAALSVTWALLGVGLMILGHRRVKRVVWGLGAALLGVVVAKLFFIELADHGGLYRIVSFIVVGLLLLVVGYFAPVPPGEDTQGQDGDKDSA